MAQPPTSDVNETFLREVDENLRRDRIRDFFVDNKGLLIAAVGLFLIAAGGMIWWQSYRQQQAGLQVEELSDVYQQIGEGRSSGLDPKLDRLSGSSAKAVRASGLLLKADIALDKGDLAKASSLFGQIAGDGSLPQAYRDAASLRQVTIEFDKLGPQAVIARIDPLAQPDSPWFGSAGEVKAMALIKQGKTHEAGQLFASIAANPQVPEALRGRAVQIAGSLGVDASNAMPATPAQ